MTIHRSCSVFLRVLLLTVMATAAVNAMATSSSTNYAIFWNSFSTGQEASSLGYTLMSVPAQNASGESSSLSYVHVAGFLAPPDNDNDKVKNFLDNCIEVINTNQRDTNVDGFGNICDPDLNNNGVVNFLDLGIMRSVLFTTDPDADLDGNGSVNFIDLGIMRSMLFQPPGPSGIAP